MVNKKRDDIALKIKSEKTLCQKYVDLFTAHFKQNVIDVVA